MPPEGLEPSPDSKQTARIHESGGSKSVNIDASLPPVAPVDPDLAAVAAAWPNLPPALRAGILAMVNASLPQLATKNGGAM